MSILRQTDLSLGGWDTVGRQFRGHVTKSDFKQEDRCESRISRTERGSESLRKVSSEAIIWRVPRTSGARITIDTNCHRRKSGAPSQGGELILGDVAAETRGFDAVLYGGRLSKHDPRSTPSIRRLARRPHR